MTERFVALRRLLADPEPKVRAVVEALFRHETTVPRAALEAAIGREARRSLIDLGLLDCVGGRCVPRARIGDLGGCLVSSDLITRRRERDFVVGVGPAGRFLASFVRPIVGRRALDLGTGSGVLALLLARRGATVDAIDINPRALGFTRFNAVLSGLPGVRPRIGDFLGVSADPSSGTTYDTIVSNPPFVLSPSTGLTYRDRSLPGDDVSARTLDRVARGLVPGGRGYVLTNWVVRGSPADPDSRVRAWIKAAGLDGFVAVARDQAPAAYAADWERDLPEPARTRSIAAWTRALRAEGVERIRIGVVALGRPATDAAQDARIRVVDMRAGPTSREEVERFLTGQRAS